MSLKDGNLFFDRVNVTPSIVRSGEDIDVEVVIGNGALAISLDEPDACRNDNTPCEGGGIFDPNGYCVEVEILPEWEDPMTETDCVRMAIDGIGKTTFRETIQAPVVTQEREMNVDIRLRGSSGEGEEDLQIEPVTINPPESGNGGGGGGGGGGDGETIFGLPREQALVAGGGLGLGALMLGATVVRNRD